LMAKRIASGMMASASTILPNTMATMMTSFILDFTLAALF
jgi:hypothetical protein